MSTPTAFRLLSMALVLAAAQGCSGSVEGVAVLEDGWQHRWDEPPTDPAARARWFESDDGWLPSPAPPRQPPDRQGRRVVWQRVKLPADLGGGPRSLFVNFVDQNFEVFLDGKSIHRFAAAEGEPLLVGRPWHLIALGEGASGRRVSFRVVSDHVAIGLGGRVRVGPSFALLRDRVRDGLPAFVLGLIFLALGLVMMPFMFGRDQGVLVRRLGILSLLTGVYVTFNAYSPVKQLAADAPVLYWYLELGALYLLPALYLGYYVDAFPTVRFRRALGGFVWVFYGGTALALGGSLLGLFPLIKTLFAFEVLLSAALVMGIVSAGLNARQGASESWATLAGFAAVAVTGLRDSQVDMRGLPGETYVTPWGFLALMVSLGYVLLRRYMDTVVKLGRYSRELESRNVELTTAKAFTATAVESLERDVAALREATARQVELAGRQADALRNTSASAQEIAQTSGEAATAATRVVEDARRSEALSEEGRTQVKATVQAMEQVSGQVDGIARRLEELSGLTERIDELAATLNDLAERSNMLSLNASLEAARSGEKGAGFAIVAHEMRALAEQSRGDVQTVRGLLTQIVRASEAAALATGEGTQTARGAVGQARGAGSAIDGLAQVIRESSSAAVQIATRSREQTEGVNGIVGALQEATGAMNAVLDGTRSIEAVAESLTSISNDLAALAGGDRKPGP